MEIKKEKPKQLPSRWGFWELLRLLPLASLVLGLLVSVYSCERRSSPEKVRPAATRPEAIKPGEINLKDARLAAIPEDYDQWGNISFSADGQQVLYSARKKGKHFIVVATIDGEHTGPAYDGGSFLVKSPDGRRFAFGGREGGKKHLVVDNIELKDPYHEEVAPGAFSPDGRLVACEVGGLKEKKWFILVSDGENEIYRSPVYPDTYRRASFSPDGHLLVYELGDDKRSIGNNKKRILFFLDVAANRVIKERACEDCVTRNISFNSDSSRAIYGVRKEGKNFLVLLDFALSEERQVELPYDSAGEFALSPKGKKIIYVANKQGKHFLVESPWDSPAKGKERGPYEGITRPVFGSDRTRVVYHAMKKGKWWSVAGGKEGLNYDIVGDDTAFSSDGANIAYAANRGGHRGRLGFTGGKWFMTTALVQKPAAVKEGPAYDMVISPVFSPDGRRIAYRARNGPMEKARRFIVVADARTGKVIKEGPAGDEIWPPVWSGDSKAVGYGARIGRELWWKVQKLP